MRKEKRISKIVGVVSERKKRTKGFSQEGRQGKAEIEKKQKLSFCERRHGIG